MSLVLLDDVKTRLGIPLGDNQYDDFLNQQITFVSATIEDYCGRKFNKATYTQTFYYDEVVQKSIPKDKLFLFHYPIDVLTSIEVDGEVQDVSDYRLNKTNASLIKTNSGRRVEFFNGCDDVVVIVYDAGYDQADIPVIIQEVCYGIIGERFNKHKLGIDVNFGSDVQRLSIPGTISIDFDYSLETNSRSRRHGNVIGNYANQLDPFRSERVIVGDIEEKYLE